MWAINKNHNTINLRANRIKEIEADLFRTFQQTYADAFTSSQLTAKWGKVAAFMIDLDDFKEVNDHFGHQKGNSILKEVAASLQKVAADESVVARCGGDEFVLVTPYMEDGYINKLIEQLHNREIEYTTTFGMSVGHAIYPDVGETLGALI